MNMHYGNKGEAPFPELVLNLKDSSKKGVNRIPKWPTKMAEGAVFYRTIIPTRCLNERKGELVYSFGPLPSLHVYSAKTFEKKDEVKVESRFHEKPDEYPQGRSTDPHTLKKYKVEEFNYGRIRYDPYRDLYYRQVLHPVDYEKPDGKTVRSFGDKPWSVMVLSPDLELVDEVQFDPAKFNVKGFKVVPQGWLVHNKTQSNRQKDVYSLFRIDREK